jgi:hypothetical protein
MQNNAVPVEVNVVSYDTAVSTVVRYDSAMAGDFNLCTDYHALAVKVTPPIYPAQIDRIQACYAAASGNTVYYSVWDDDGPNGSPGRVLSRLFGSVPGPGWQTALIPACTVRSGSVYVGYRTATRSGPSIATDTTPPLSRQCWERQVDSLSWAEWRWNRSDGARAGRELLIRCRLSVPPAASRRDVACLGIVLPADTLYDTIVMPFPVSVRVQNVGNVTIEGLPVRCLTMDGMYDFTGTTGSPLSPGEMRTLAMMPCPPHLWPGRHTFYAWTMLTGDINPANDTASAVLWWLTLPQSLDGAQATILPIGNRLYDACGRRVRKVQRHGVYFTREGRKVVVRVNRHAE